jgi:nucleoside-diphosphate-sugar epimerase
MKVLVTGATGFFGTEIVDRLREAGHEVVGASRHAVRMPGSEPIDVTSRESCDRAVAAASPDVVVHAAALAHVRPGALSEELCLATNGGGTRNMVDACVNTTVRRFVFISSVMVYGDYDLPRVLRETDPCVAHSVYGEAKILGESACQARAGEIEVFVLRLATMYSPDWYRNIRKRVRPLTLGRPLYFTLDPHSRRYSLCSRRNGAEAVLWATESRMSPDVYNVSDGYQYSQMEILRAVERTDGPGPCLHIPLIVPKLMWHAVRVAVPFRRRRVNAHSRYWKFCESNLYSPEKLNACGLLTSPDLLTFGRVASRETAETT